MADALAAADALPLYHSGFMRGPSPHDRWVERTGVPVYEGYYVEDLRTLELGPWAERGCRAAFLRLAGQEGITEARVTEIPPGGALPPIKFALDETVYVLEGRGLATVRGVRSERTFEWQKHSLFMFPRNCTWQLANTQGSSPARLLHYNYLPIAMSIVPDPGAYFDTCLTSDFLERQGDGVYSEAKLIHPPDSEGSRRGRAFWVGNFFPDMKAWDKLVNQTGRGAGARAVFIQYSGSPMSNHMTVVPSGAYKKAHRHGPGVVIVIPEGEGYSIMWPTDGERIVIPWHEGSVFVPPNRWFHQHFSVGRTPARYLAFHGPPSLSAYNQRVTNQGVDQIEYPDEDPWIRRKFEEELAERGLTSEMPPQAYVDRDYEWAYDGGE